MARPIPDDQATRWDRLAQKSQARVDALLHSITIAQLSTELDPAIRDVLT